jgi:ubiquinone/menaquinone biosynthesis C-methylase UbiE
MIQELQGNRTDIYLLDQIQRGRISMQSTILDAGCGSGRNAEWFIRENADIRGIDGNYEAIAAVHQNIKSWNPDFDTKRFQTGDIGSMPYPEASFDFIISSAVLHFANNDEEFRKWFAEHVRVLRPGGIFWIRMTSTHTFSSQALDLGTGQHALPDGSQRYLLKKPILDQLMQNLGLEYLDPFKTVNVEDSRTMTTLALQKTKIPNRL